MWHFTECGGSYQGPSGIIKSPNFPNTYPGNKQCTYVINTIPGKVINLAFQNFDVEGPDHCGNDYLSIRDGNSATDAEITRLCGDGMPSPIISSFNHLYLEFKTDASIHRAGFLANYSVIDIGTAFSLHFYQTVLLRQSQQPACAYFLILFITSSVVQDVEVFWPKRMASSPHPAIPITTRAICTAYGLFEHRKDSLFDWLSWTSESSPILTADMIMSRLTIRLVLSLGGMIVFFIFRVSIIYPVLWNYAEPSFGSL